MDRKRKRAELNQDVNETSESSEAPKVNKNFSVSLIQALLTSDKKLLEKLLSTNDVNAINETVLQLTPPLVLALIEFISNNIIKSANLIYSKEGWINSILRTHLKFFANNARAKDALIKLNRHIHIKLATNKALLRLKGKVDSVVYLSTLYNKKQSIESIHKRNAQEPLVTFEEHDE